MADNFKRLRPYRAKSPETASGRSVWRPWIKLEQTLVHTAKTRPADPATLLRSPWLRHRPHPPRPQGLRRSFNLREDACLLPVVRPILLRVRNDEVDPTRAEASSVQAARLPALEPPRRALPTRRRPQMRETRQDPQGPLRPLRPRDRLHPVRPLPPRGPAAKALHEDAKGNRQATAPLPLRAAGALRHRSRPDLAPPPRSPTKEPSPLLDAHRRKERTQGEMTALLAIVLAFSPAPAVTRCQASTHLASLPLTTSPAGSGTADTPRARTCALKVFHPLRVMCVWLHPYRFVTIHTGMLYLLRTRLFFGCVNPQITALLKTKRILQNSIRTEVTLCNYVLRGRGRTRMQCPLCDIISHGKLFATRQKRTKLRI